MLASLVAVCCFGFYLFAFSATISTIARPRVGRDHHGTSKARQLNNFSMFAFLLSVLLMIDHREWEIRG